MNQKPTAAQLAGTTALSELRNSAEVQAILNRLIAAQGAQEADGSWDSTAGRKTEAAMGYLRMALEAAGARI